MEYRMYIMGEFVSAVDGRRLEVINPATEEVVREVPYGSRRDVRQAIEAAGGAFPSWRDCTAYERARFLFRTAELLRGRAEEAARLITLEVGKPLFESRAEVEAAAATFEWCAEEVKRRWGEWIPSQFKNKRLLTFRVPLGVVAAIAPWNFPLMLMVRKVAPALACGNTVVARPASQTPLANMLLWNCFHEAGLPPGVANLVTSPPGECGDEFLSHPAVRKISFTGSVAVGKELMAKAAPQLKRLSLELGGHSPFIVCDDVSPAEAAERAVAGKFRNMGQVCISPSRFYVPEKMRREFEEETARRAQALKIGNGLDPATQVGPLHERLRVAATEGLVEDAVKKGAQLLAGGRRPSGSGYERGFWFEPTVLTDITPEMVLMKEEPFAPILPIIGYTDLDEAVAAANNTTYGLAAYVITHDLSRAFRLAEALEAGVIGINDPAPSTAQAPFGGMKESGIGRECGHEGIEAYTEVKFVSFLLGDRSR